jgi:hypothetical protein
MRGQFPGAGFSGTSTRLQCGTHQSSAVWCPTFSENPGEFSSPSQNPGGHLPGILGKSGNLHHQTASFAGAPITPRERCHVTQPRAGINVCCSRAGHKGRRPRNGHERRAAKDSKRWVPDRKPQFEKSYRVYLLAN